MSYVLQLVVTAVHSKALRYIVADLFFVVAPIICVCVCARACVGEWLSVYWGMALVLVSFPMQSSP